MPHHYGDGTLNRADILTKPLTAAEFARLRHLIMNVDIMVQGVHQLTAEYGLRLIGRI